MLDTVLPLYAAAILTVLWVYVALAAFTGTSLPAETWSWLESLDTLPAIVAWLAILPVGVFLWAEQADLEPLFFGLVMVGLVAWTFFAWSGLIRAALRLRRARSAR